MVPKTQTIVTNEELAQKTQQDAVTPDKPFAVVDNRVTTNTTPSVQGGYPTENFPKASEDALQEIGKAEAQKMAAQKTVLNNNKFDTLVQRNASKPLLRIKTAKILDFFPSEITIETNKVNVSQRDFFFMRRLHTISIEDIEDVFVEMTPLYASLKIVDKGFVENTVEVQFLKKKDAKRARRVIQGLITAYKEKVDLHTLPAEGLVEKLEILGGGGVVEKVSVAEKPQLPF